MISLLISDIALLKSVAANSNNGAIRGQSKRVIHPSTDHLNIGPIICIALTVLVKPGADNSTIPFQTDGMPIPCADGNGISPGGDITFTIIIIACCNNRSVRL